MSVCWWIPMRTLDYNISWCSKLCCRPLARNQTWFWQFESPHVLKYSQWTLGISHSISYVIHLAIRMIYNKCLMFDGQSSHYTWIISLPRSPNKDVTWISISCCSSALSCLANSSTLGIQIKCGSLSWNHARIPSVLSLVPMWSAFQINLQHLLGQIDIILYLPFVLHVILKCSELWSQIRWR